MTPLNRPSVPEVLPLVNAYYCFKPCGVGGSLHIVLDDGNIADGHIEYCIECARDPDFHICKDFGRLDEAGELLGRLLLLMSWTQRKTLVDRSSGGYGKADAIEHNEFVARCRALLEKYPSAAALPAPGGAKETDRDA